MQLIGKTIKQYALKVLQYDERKANNYVISYFIKNSSDKIRDRQTYS